MSARKAAAAPRASKGKAGAKAGRAGGGGPPLSAVLGHGDLAESLLFVFPLMLVYAVGVLLVPEAGNGADYLNRWMYQALGYSARNYLLVYGVLTVAFLGVAWYLRRRGDLRVRRFAMTLVEGGVIALTLGSFVFFVMQKILGFGPIDGLGVGGRVVASFGAGVNEELVYRLGLFAGGAALLRLAGVGHRVAMLLASLGSSLLFALVHHLGPNGDPWALSVFTQRAIAGAVLSAIFYFRSLATAAWGHALYDVYVMVFLQSF